jgi:hypothetical protein
MMLALLFDRGIPAIEASTSEDVLNSTSIVGRTLSATVVICLIIAAYLLVVRPAQLHWGATDAEVARIMPGDTLSFRPTFLATRVITIDAAPEVIWPWLVQMGYGRAGFYGYDILENLGSARGIHSAERIVPDLQQIAVGDALPLSAAGGLVINAIEPNHFIVWSGKSGRYPGAFTWALYPVDASHTRLVSRIQWSHHWTQPLALVMDLFTEFADHIAVRKVLRGVKDRAEGRVESFARQTVEFAVLLWALINFFMAIWLTLRNPFTRRAWLCTIVAGLMWLVVWYAPIPMGLGTVANVVVLWFLYSARANKTLRASVAGRVAAS